MGVAGKRLQQRQRLGGVVIVVVVATAVAPEASSMARSMGSLGLAGAGMVASWAGPGRGVDWLVGVLHLGVGVWCAARGQSYGGEGLRV